MIERNNRFTTLRQMIDALTLRQMIDALDKQLDEEEKDALQATLKAIDKAEKEGEPEGQFPDEEVV